MTHPSRNAASDDVGVRGIYRVVVRSPGPPEGVARELARLLGLPDPPLYDNDVAAARGAALELPSGAELLVVEPLGEGDGLLTRRMAAAGPAGLVVVTLEVDDVDHAVAVLRGRGASVDDPVATGRGRRMALVAPESTAGISLALIQLPPPA